MVEIGLEFSKGPLTFRLNDRPVSWTVHFRLDPIYLPDIGILRGRK